ncbi:MAG: arginine--tRNA ligase [Pseudomonadota bacterium]
MRLLKQDIIELLESAVATVRGQFEDVSVDWPTPEVTRTKDAAHGDFATNAALQLARPLQRKPREIAEMLVAAMPENTLVSKVEIAGPGFINLFLNEASATQVVSDVLAAGARFGTCEAQVPQRILLEYVSANPTGPLHVGHGRHAAYGATLANLLRAVGHEVHEEYYVNDAGRQMDILAASVFVRALQQLDIHCAFPNAGYRGDYIRTIASDWASAQPLKLTTLVGDIFDALPEDGEDEAKEGYIDALIERCERVLGPDAFATLQRFAKDAILDDIREDLAGFGVRPQLFFSEASLNEDGALDTALDVLRDNNVLYEKGGAWWFRATDYGDEKDRVVVRENGKTTYFASDIAYHLNKRHRGFDCLLDVLGSDHHGYVARVRAGLTAMQQPADSLEVRLVQFVTLYRGGEKMQMGTRSGNFVSLRELRAEVGNDAARFFYIMRSNDQHLDFDLELATSQTSDNPVYYIQYAHARVASVFRQLNAQSIAWDRASGEAHITMLSESHEQALITRLGGYTDTLASAAGRRAPQTLVNYLRELANDLHSYYNAHKFIIEDSALRDARLTLIRATQQVLANGLSILGVSAPDTM